MLLIAVAAALPPGTGPHEARAQTPVAVSIAGFQFAPATVNVSLGTAVTWTNRDSDPHTASGSGWASGVLSQGQSFTYVTQRAGSFSYICEIHPTMSGTLTVTGSALATATPSPTASPLPAAATPPVAAGTTTATAAPTASPGPSPVVTQPTASPGPSPVVTQPTASPGPSPVVTQPTAVSTPAATATSAPTAESGEGSSGVLSGGIVSVVLFSIGAGIMLMRRRPR